MFNSPHDQTSELPDQAPSAPDQLIDDDTLDDVREIVSVLEAQGIDPFATHDDAGSEEPGEFPNQAPSVYLQSIDTDMNESTPPSQGGVHGPVDNQPLSCVQQHQ